MKKLLLFFLFAFLLKQFTIAQCSVSTSATTTTITCGQSVYLSAFGQSTGTVVLNENFNSGGFGPGWSSTPGSVNFSNPCSSGGVDGTTHAWMDNNTSVPRILTSSPYDLSTATAGVTICFDLLFAEQGNSAPCEGPDEPDEGVFLQYSTDGGANWVDIHYFDPNGGNDPQFTTWHNWCFVVPAAAITSNTMFQWLQTADSGADYDHWGIDNVQIYQNDISSELVWLHDGYSYGIGNPGGVNPTPVAPLTTTTYTAQLTTGTGTVCTDAITITVVDPVFDVNIVATPSTLCPGDCANITATAEEIISPHTTPTFENNEFEVVTGGSASVNINVQGLNTTSIFNGFITQVVINGFNFSGNSFCSNFGGCPCNGGTVSFGQSCTLNTSGFTVTLTAPGGCDIILAPAGAATGDYTNTTFVPVGGTAIGGTFPNGGTWAPNEAMSGLNGCNPNGVWTLSFDGADFGFGFGTLEGWSISFDDPAILGPVTYTWSPTTAMTNSNTLTPTVCPAASTTYSLTVANPYPGCATYTESVPITVSPCSGCTPPVFTVTPPASVCAPGTIDLASAVSGEGANIITYHASNADATSDINPLPSSVVSSSGTYFVRAEDPLDPTCFSVQSVVVTVNPIVTVSVNPSAATICPGGSVNLTASGAGSYTWANAAGLNTTTGASVVAGPASTTTYTVTGTTGSCTGDTTIIVTVGNDLVIDVTPPSATVCPGTPVNLTASGATNYTWSPGTDLSATTGATVTSTPAATITYTVTGTTGGCTGDTTVTITVSNNLVVDVTPAAPTVCPGGSVNLTASGATNYTWSPGTDLSATTGATVTSTPAATITYTVTGTTGGCTGDTTVTVTVSNALVISVNPSSATVCPSTPVNLTASGATNYTWSPGTDLSATTGANVTSTPSATITYTVTGTSGGCTGDTTVTITVSNNLLVSVTPTDTTVCPNQPVNIVASGATNYTWSPGTDLSATTGANVTSTPSATITYTVTGTSGGCTGDTTVTITVSNNLLVSATPTDTTVCPNQPVNIVASGATNYTWSPGTDLSATTGASVTSTPSATITYTVTGTSGGCTGDTTVTITVSNNLLVSATPIDTTVCPNQPVNIIASGATNYSWSPATNLSATTGASVTSTPSATITYTVTGTSGGCTGDTTVTITVSNNLLVSTTPTDTTVCPNQPVNIVASGATNYTWSPATNLSATTGANVTSTPSATITYTVTGTSAGCTDDTTITINVANVLLVTASSSSSAICTGANSSITANGAGTYQWLPATGLSSTTGATVTASPTVTTTYTVTGTQGGCTGDTTITITILPPLPLNITASSNAVCNGTNTTLNVTGANSYTWTPASSLNTSTGATVIANPTVNTTYTVTGITSTCSGSGTITIAVTPVPAINLTPSNVTICVGDSSQIDATGATTYAWAPNTNFTSLNGTNSSVLVFPPSSTTYTVIGSMNGCNNSAMVNVTVLPKIIPNAGVNDTICFGESLTLIGTGGTSSAWTPTLWLTTPNLAFTNASPLATTNYVYTGSYNGQCAESDTVTVVVNPLPAVFAGNDTTIDVEDEAMINASSNTSNISWVNASTLNCSNCLNPVAGPTETTTYILVATNQYGCVNADTMTITVSQDYALYVPNAFSPNEDNINEGWKPQGFGIKKIQIYIYDRWGEKLFEIKDLDTAWDGIYKGDMVQQDVYVYKISAETFSGNKIGKVGHITVVR